MRKVLTAVVIGAALTFLAGCKIRTPEIRGVVLDAETKEPVADAWVRATIDLETKTVAGKVESTLSIDEPHTRTDREGRFAIPSKSFKKPPIPAGFGTEVLSVAIWAGTVDDIGARVNYYGGYRERDFGKGAGDLNELLAKESVELILYAKPYERTESEYFSRLQSLYRYCLRGRSNVEMPPVEGGCDAWETDFAITLHERYLERYTLTEENRSHRSGAFEQLGYLHERKGEYAQAIENLKKAKEIRYFRPQDIDFEIKRIQQLIRKQQPQP